MLSHAERIAAARSVIDYVCGRTPEEMTQPVPNCPGWTVYHAASHIGRVSIAWESMILASPEDPESRTRGYDEAGRRPEGAEASELAAWAHSAIDRITADVDAPSYFSMTGGHGNHGLWAWHAASELGVHRLDVESALGHDHGATEAGLVDSLTYACNYFLPAMRRATEEDPGALIVRAHSPGGDTVEPIELPSETDRQLTVSGTPLDLLLAVWGRPHGPLDLVGDEAVLADWRDLPGKAFQFGAWD